MINKNKINLILKEKFGFNKLRNNQEDIINSILNNNNTLGIMATGGGKSLTYYISGLYLPGTTLVISPLISLMEDQVKFLQSKNIEAEYYNSSIDEDKKNEIINKIKDNNIKFLYISPERLFIHENFNNKIESFLDNIKKYININLIVIDEAHCMSSWGHSFREDYLRLNEIKNYLPNIPILALTATADNITKDEIIKNLNIKNTFIDSVLRKNLEYYIEKKISNGFLQVEKIIKKHKNESGIVYCFTKDSVNKLTRELKRKKILVESYHADLKEDKKKKILKDFLDNKIDVIVATIAFGMGIDKKNIRYIIHKDIPKTIENYYQETGRAGRDGKISKTYFLYSKKDLVSMNWILNSSNRKFIEKNKLNLVKNYVETSICRKKVLNWYFNEEFKEKNCNQCDFCLDKNINKNIIDKEFIEFLNKNLFNNEINLFDFEKFLIQSNKSQEIARNYLYQLIFSNLIEINKEKNTIFINKKIPLNFKFSENRELPFNFIVNSKITNKRTKKNTTNTTRKKITRKTTTKKRTLTPEHLKKLQDGRKKKLEEKKRLEKRKK